LKSAVFGYFSGAKQLLGFDKEVLKEPGCRILIQQNSPGREAIHVIAIYNELVRSLGVETNGLRFDLNTSEEDDAYVSSQLVSRQVGDFVILNPGSGWVTKNWDPENYAALHLRLRQTTRLQPVLTWGPGEENLIEHIFQICQEDPPIAFSTTISQFIALVPCQVVCRRRHGPDASSGRLWYSGRWDLWSYQSLAKWTLQSERHCRLAQVPCGPCYKRSCEIHAKECMRLVTVDEVHNAVLQRLGLH
jgi:ADP-heptose:LPS heptosyltransferase